MENIPAVNNTILVVDDDPGIREALLAILEKEGYRVYSAEDGAQGLTFLSTEPISLIIADLKMAPMDGLELLRKAQAVSREIPVILITGHGTIEDAVEAMKDGAHDFITKPFKKVVLLHAVRKALEARHLLLENRRLRRELESMAEAKKIIGSTPPMQRLTALISQVAPATATVLILGESGTGKELVAEAIHALSPRGNGPLVKVSCAAIPEALLESEMFGHEKGAFTGAIRSREGRFELAHGGSIFLDEIGDMSPGTQAKLLRAIETGEFERIGGIKTTKVDVRIFAATHRDLRALVKEGRFREDLYFRLNVVTILVPPLRERKDDIPLLATHFLRVYGEKTGKHIEGFSREALSHLTAYTWPGNVRELENAVERAVVIAKGPVIEGGDLPDDVRMHHAPDGRVTFSLGTPLNEVEKKLIEEALRATQGDITKASQLLGISPRTIYRRLHKSEGRAPAR